MKAWRRMIALFLCLSLALPLVGCQNEDGTAEKVKSVEEAITQLAGLGEAYNYKNALSELTEKNTATVDGDTYYRLQQNYQGIPVYGQTAVYIADKRGNRIAITGNVSDVDGLSSLTPSISQSKAETFAKTHFTNTLKYDSNLKLNMKELDESYLCIYNSKADGSSHLAYCLPVIASDRDYSGLYEIIIDANTGKVLLCNDLLVSEKEVKGTLQGQQATYQDVKYSQDESGKNQLVDFTRNISSTMAKNNHEFSKDALLNVLLTWKGSAWVYDWNGEDTEIVSWTEGSQPDRAGVDAFVNTQIAYDFFDLVLGNKSTDGNGEAAIKLVSGVQIEDGEKDWTGNAYSISGLFSSGQNETRMVFGIGDGKNPSSSAAIDTVAHEYMHGVEKFHSRMIYQGESGAIMEALSDIFGEIVEAWYNGNRSFDDDVKPDWIHNSWRNLADPAKTKNPDTYGGENWGTTTVSGEDGNDNGHVHKNSTVLSHAAYLMWNGIDEDSDKMLTTEQLAKLWYRAMLMMPSDCDFAQCRTLVELAAESLDLTDKQQRCVSEAFDAVGISDGETADYTISPNAELCVYDANGELYGNYSYHVSGTLSHRASELGQMYEETQTVSTAEPRKLALKEGYYTIRLMDNAGAQQPYTFTVHVALSGGKDQLEIYTDYGKNDASLPPESGDSLSYEMRETTIEFPLSDGRIYYKNTVNYPYFLGTSKAETEINQKYSDIIAEYRNNDCDYDELYAQQKQNAWVGNVDNQIPYYDDVTAEVTYNQNGVVSIKQTDVMWSGGMHPYAGVYGQIYDISSGEILTYRDILQGTDSDIDNVLKNALEEEIGQVTTYQLKVLKEDTGYALTNKGICFYYNVGDALERLEVLIPFTDEDTYIITVGSDAPEISDETSMSSDELAYYGNLLSPNDTPDNNAFLTCYYNSPQEIDPNAVLYSLWTISSSIEEADKRDLIENYGYTEDDFYMSVSKYKVADINAFFQRKLGCSLEDLEIEIKETYSPQMDSYYFFHGDTNLYPLEVKYGRSLGDGIYVIGYTGGPASVWPAYDGISEVTFKDIGGDLQFISNKRVSDA